MKFRQWTIMLVGLAALVALAVMAVSMFMASTTEPPAALPPTAGRAAAPPQADAHATADRVLAVLKVKDGPALAALVDDRGVRLTPSAFVDVAADQVLSPAEVRAFWTDRASRVWGYIEASGDPIDLTPAAYAARYILDHDYANATVSVNGNTDRGTTTDNTATAYPGATRVEYFRQGSDPLDWSALRLVLAPAGNGWRLIGIIHDEWTP